MSDIVSKLLLNTNIIQPHNCTNKQGIRLLRQYKKFISFIKAILQVHKFNTLT